MSGLTHKLIAQLAMVQLKIYHNLISASADFNATYARKNGITLLVWWFVPKIGTSPSPKLLFLFGLVK